MSSRQNALTLQNVTYCEASKTRVYAFYSLILTDKIICLYVPVCFVSF